MSLVDIVVSEFGAAVRTFFLRKRFDAFEAEHVRAGNDDRRWTLVIVALEADSAFILLIHIISFRLFFSNNNNIILLNNQIMVKRIEHFRSYPNRCYRILSRFSQR